MGAETSKIPPALRDNRGETPARKRDRRRTFDRIMPAITGAAQPRGKWELVGQRVRLHRVELRREELGVRAGDAKDDERAGVAQDGGADFRRNLVRELVA